MEGENSVGLGTVTLEEISRKAEIIRVSTIGDQIQFETVLVRTYAIDITTPDRGIHRYIQQIRDAPCSSTTPMNSFSEEAVRNSVN